MISTIRIGALAGVLAFALVSADARADVTVHVQHKSGVDSKKASVATSVLSIAPDRFAQKWEGDDTGDGDLIFRGDRDVLWILDHGDKTYAEIDKAAVENVGGKLSEAMSKIESELAKLPPDQRALFEQTMKDLPGALSESLPEVSFQKTSEQKTISGFPCTKYERREDGVVTQMLWVAPHSATGITSADTAVFGEMMTMVESLLGTFGPGAKDLVDAGLSVITKLDGWPILVQDLEAGEVVEEARVQSIERGAVPPATFEVPEGYAKKSLAPGE